MAVNDLNFFSRSFALSLLTFFFCLEVFEPDFPTASFFPALNFREPKNVSAVAFTHPVLLTQRRPLNCLVTVKKKRRGRGHMTTARISIGSQAVRPSGEVVFVRNREAGGQVGSRQVGAVGMESTPHRL